MKSKLHFLVKFVLALLGLVILLLFSIYITSFIVFSMRSSGAWYLPRMGFLGLKNLFGVLPWILILLSAGLIVLLEIFSERLSFVYKRPMIYSLAAIIAIVLVGGFVVSKTPLHESLFTRAEEGRLPIFGPFYQQFGSPSLRNVHNGIVKQIIERDFIIENLRNASIRVIVEPTTIMDDEIHEGDAVLIIGEMTKDGILAQRVKKIDQDFNLRRPRTLPR